MKIFKRLLFVVGILALGALVWLGVLYRVYGLHTLLFLLKSPPEFILTYSKSIFAAPPAAPADSIIPAAVDGVLPPARIEIPDRHMIGTMSHAYQKLNNCGPVSASMAASTLGITFDQFFAADVLKGNPSDKNVSPRELAAFLETQGLKAIYRVNGNAAALEQFIAQDIPVIAEQWLVKSGPDPLTGHYRVMRGYDQTKRLFTTNDSYNGANFVIPYAQFDEWWRPFNRGYLVVYTPEQEETVKTILGSDWVEVQNWQTALEKSQAEAETIADGYADFNLGTNATLMHNYDLAVSAFDRALKTTFPKTYLWYQFGHLEAYYQHGQYDRVLQLTDSLLGAAGEVEEARYYRGLVFIKQGKLDEAKTELEKALQANPRYLLPAQALEEL